MQFQLSVLTGLTSRGVTAVSGHPNPSCCPSAGPGLPCSSVLVTTQTLPLPGSLPEIPTLRQILSPETAELAYYPVQLPLSCVRKTGPGAIRLLSHVWLSATPWPAAHQAALSLAPGLASFRLRPTPGACSNSCPSSQ